MAYKHKRSELPQTVLLQSRHAWQHARHNCELLQLQQLNIKRPYKDTQNKPAWREKTWATHTYHM